nr:hypothetical protein [Mesorhizobium sp. M2A.F.Ca.ET.043.05.1.1]
MQGADIEQKVDQLYEERSPFYQKADIRLPLVPPFQKDKKDARICVKELYAFLCSDREAALPAAEISHVSGASGTAISMSQQLSACTMIITTATIAGAASWKPSRRRRHY